MSEDPSIPESGATSPPSTSGTSSASAQAPDAHLPAVSLDERECAALVEHVRLAWAAEETNADRYASRIALDIGLISALLPLLAAGIAAAALSDITIQLGCLAVFPAIPLLAALFALAYAVRFVLLRPGKSASDGEPDRLREPGSGHGPASEYLHPTDLLDYCVGLPEGVLATFLATFDATEDLAARNSNAARRIRTSEYWLWRGISLALAGFVLYASLGWIVNRSDQNDDGVSQTGVGSGDVRIERTDY